MLDLKIIETTSGTLAAAGAKDFCNEKGFVNLCLI